MYDTKKPISSVNFGNSYNLVTNKKYIFFITTVCANTISVKKYFLSEVICLC